MDRKFTPTTLLIWSGLLIWAADFLFVYVFAAVACAQRFAHLQVLGFGVVPFATVLASLAAVIATALVMVYARQRMRSSPADERTGFVFFLAIALGGIALVAIAWSSLPPLLLRTGCE